MTRVGYTRPASEGYPHDRKGGGFFLLVPSDISCFDSICSRNSIDEIV